MEKTFSTFSVIPTEIMVSKEISSTAKIVYGLISSLTNEKGYCWANNKYLGELVNKEERQISNIINKLSKLGLIVSEVENNYKRKITLTGKIATQKITRGVAKKCVGGSKKMLHNNIIEKDKDNIYIADKSANDNLSENKPNIKIQDLYNKLGLKTPIKSVYQWQDEANNATQYFKDGESKRSSIFKCFKDNQQKARIAFSDCKELGRKEVLYFLKVYNELKK
jgi:hypothetical protein